MKVVVTGAGALLGQGIIRSLLASELTDLRLVAVDPHPFSAGLYWTDERYLVPKANHKKFSSAIEDLVSRIRPDVLIPGTDVELLPLALIKTRLASMYGVKVIVASPEVIRIADDKYKTYQFLTENGFSAPDSCLPGEELALEERMGYPLIVKPRVGARSQGIIKVNNRKELMQASQRTKNAIIQECVGTDDNEYTAGTLYMDGECSAAIVMRRDLRDGNTYRAYIEKSPELLDQVRSFANALKADGPANFQFRLDRHGQAKVFEINARFSGTTPLRALAGFNEVEMCINGAIFRQPIIQPVVKNATFLRYWSETMIEDNADLAISSANGEVYGPAP